MIMTTGYIHYDYVVEYYGIVSKTKTALLWRTYN